MMKKLLIFLLFMFVINANYAQNVLDGIFDIRLGMTEKEVRKVVDTSLLSKNIEHIDLKDEFGAFGNRVKSLILERYTPLTDYIVKDIHLYFADDKLYLIKISKYNDIMEDLLSLKYGFPEVTNDYGNPGCKGKRIVKRWKTNHDEIVCIARLCLDVDNSINYNLTIANMISILPIIEEVFGSRQNGVENPNMQP